MNVLVLSATGTTGRETVRALIAQGATVRAATRDPAAASFPEGVEVVRFSLEDASTWVDALRDVDALYLALPPFRPDEVELGQDILRAAVESGVRRIVKLSARGVENSPEGAHRRLEIAVEQSGLDWVTLRPSFFMDNFVNLHGHSIRDTGGFYVPAGDGKTVFIAASDIGEAAAAALLGDASGEIWELTGSESLDRAQVAAVISEVTGREVRYHALSAEQFAGGMKEMGMSADGIDFMSGLYAAVRAGWTDGATDTVQRVTGKAPVRFADWAAEHAAAWRV
jgi:uncharacterized protein YbjT (DUF2867 family)